MRATSVTAVVVTYNRAALLVECLDAIAAQTHRPGRVIVVDNASTDDTATVLSQRRDVDTVRLALNTGGAGGFAAGIQAALAGGCDAVWLLDDDTIPQPDALAELVRAREAYPGATPAVVASRVVWTDGRDHPMNTPRTLPGATRDDARRGRRCRRSSRPVGLVRVGAGGRGGGGRARAAGCGLLLVERRLRVHDAADPRRRRACTCPTSVVVHKTRVFGSTDADPGDRFYWEVRNKVWMFTRSGSLSPVEKVAYGGSTLTRWIRTFIDSPDRSTLRDGLRRGLADAWTAPPRPTEDVLAEAAEPRP